MPYWTSTHNEPRPDAPGADLVEEYEASGDFAADYLTYARLLGVIPHPALAPPGLSREPDDARAAAEREVADAVRHQKRRRKKPVVKRAAAPQQSQQDTEDSPDFNLRVSNYAIDSGTARAMALALRWCDSLTSLCVERVEVSRSALASLVSAVAAHRRLRSLVLDGTDFPAACADPMAGPPGPDILRGHPLEALTQPASMLQTLSLRCCKVDDQSARAIAEMLRRNTSLMSLDLWGNHIGDDGATSIALALRKNATLVCICLAHNRIGDAGAEAIQGCLTSYVLPPDEVIARKKIRMDLEQKKVDLTARRKGKVAQQTGQTGTAPKNKRKDQALEEQVEEQLRAILPLEEHGNQWIVAGNRTLLAVLMSGNQISEKVAESLYAVTETNTVITNISC